MSAYCNPCDLTFDTVQELVAHVNDVTHGAPAYAEDR